MIPFMAEQKLDLLFFSIFTVRVTVRKKKREDMDSKSYNVGYLIIKKKPSYSTEVWKDRLKNMKAASLNSIGSHRKIECTFSVTMKLEKDWLQHSVINKTVELCRKKKAMSQADRQSQGNALVKGGQQKLSWTMALQWHFHDDSWETVQEFIFCLVKEYNLVWFYPVFCLCFLLYCYI